MTSPPPPCARRTVLGGLIVLILAQTAVAETRPAAVTISGAWARPAAAGANGAVYLSIANRGRDGDALIAVASPAAARASIHESRRVGAVMTMRAAPSLAIPPGAMVTLAPGGLHVMLEGLKRPLKVGDRVPATLTFRRAGPVRVIFQVRAGASASMGAMAM